MADVFRADTLEECQAWIDEDLRGRTPVDGDHPCTDDVFYSSSVFYYEVYDRPIVEVVDDEEIFNEAVYTSDYYYAKTAGMPIAFRHGMRAAVILSFGLQCIL